MKSAKQPPDEMSQGKEQGAHVEVPYGATAKSFGDCCYAASGPPMRLMTYSLAPRLLSVLRIVAGFLILCHGTQKLFGVPGAHPMHLPLASLLGVASLIETPGGVLLLVGLFTRPVAFILSGEMAVAYFTQHAPRGFWPIVNGGELAVCLCFVFLYLAAAGGGPWSLDARRGTRRE